MQGPELPRNPLPVALEKRIPQWPITCCVFRVRGQEWPPACRLRWVPEPQASQVDVELRAVRW